MCILARFHPVNLPVYVRTPFLRPPECVEYGVRSKVFRLISSVALAAFFLIPASTTGAFAQSFEQRQFTRLTGISDGSVARVIFDRRRKRKPIQVVYFPKRISAARLVQVQEHVCKKLFRGLDRQGVDQSYKEFYSKGKLKLTSVGPFETARVRTFFCR